MLSIPRSEWKVKLIPFGYRLITLLLAGLFVMGFENSRHLPVNPMVLFGLAGLECAVASLPPFIAKQWRSHFAGMLFSTISSALCILLLIMSGSVESPFALYSLSPVLSAALFLNRKKTALVAFVIGCAAIFCEIFNPFYPGRLSLFSASQTTVYLAAVCLIATLPFASNINLRRSLERDKVLEERQRLSREIHDGVAQTLHALCWQVQQVRQQLDATHVRDKDIEQLEKLAEKARTDILQALDILRNRGTEKDLREMLADCLEDFKGTNSIDYSLKVETGEYKEENEVKKEMVSICQEALANVKKHSSAHSVRVNVSEVHGFIEMSISDDGKGFDAISHYRSRFETNGHHGLAVMQERTKLLNGKFKVMSLPDHGTEVRVDVPLYRYKGRA
jgi:signal transduction histidine kinase